MFAMVCSFVLSRTLVPTMAKYLLRTHAHTAMRAHAAGTRNPFVRFQRGFERALRALPPAYRELLAMALAQPRPLRGRLHGIRAASFALVPLLGRDFFPVGRRWPDPHACAAPSARASRNAPPVRRHRRRRSAQIIPPHEIATSWTTSGCRSAAST